MQIGQRLKALREEKKLSQGDVEKATGLFRMYVSRVENGHTIPSVATLEKFARAFGMPLYQVMYDGNKPPAPVKLETVTKDRGIWGASGNEASQLARLRRYLAKMNDKDRSTLLAMAHRMARK